MNECSYIDLTANTRYILCIMENLELKKTDKSKIDKTLFEEAAYMLKAMANETRLCVIMQLTKKEELTVSEIRDNMECEQSLLSHHLTDMRAKGILNCRRSGKNSYYSLKNKKISNILKCIMQCSEENTELNLSDLSGNKLN